jgi:tetrahydromethanopterin S-methyltransferase subunit A
MMSELIGTIASELAAATSAPKCHACACFQEAVVALRQTELARPLAAPLSEASSSFVERRYDCLGCEVCWPANALNAASNVVDLPAEAGCPTQSPRPTGGWPVLPGDFQVIRFTAPVAVCTLHSKRLVGAIASASCEGLSIVGSLQTENLGIERLIENVVSNPNLRFLVLCGEDTQGEVGHFPGQSLLALAINGTDQAGRIQGAKGNRPWLKNLDPAVLSHFREYVEIVDAIGVSDLSRIVHHVAECAVRDPGHAPPPPRVERRVSVLQAEGPDHLVLDPAGYLVVTPDPRRGLIVVEHYDSDGVLRTVVEGKSAVDLAATIIRENLVTRSEHAAYIGRELTLAETALTDRKPYVQDRAPDAGQRSDTCVKSEETNDSADGSCSCKEAP